MSGLRKQIADGPCPSIWIKRDDELGPGLGGNKGRKLAYLLASAVNQNKRKVVTFGGLQSNHARMTAAACASIGLEAHLFFFERKPLLLTGNLMLNELFGAKMHFIPFGRGSNGTMTLEFANRIVRLISIFYTGQSTYFIPNGGHSLIGCLGYVDAACEIHEQVQTYGLAPDQTLVVVAAGTGGTLAGLMAGFALLESQVGVLGIDIGKLWKEFPQSIGHMATKICKTFGSDYSFKATDVPLIEKRYVGKAYAQPTSEGSQAIKLTAESEGILLDPIYTGKAFAGMLDLIRQKKFKTKENLIFLHTGGLPAIWA